MLNHCTTLESAEQKFNKEMQSRIHFSVHLPLGILYTNITKNILKDMNGAIAKKLELNPLKLNGA